MRSHVHFLACLVFAIAVPSLAEDAQLAPSDLAATPLSWRRVQVTWSGVDLATETRLELRVTGGSFAEIATLPVTATSYVDATTSPSTAYQYRLMVEHGVVWTSSNIDGATTDAYVAPQPTATVLSWGEVRLSWGTITQSDPGELLIQRLQNGTAFQTIATLSHTQVSFTDDSVSPSSAYEYRLVLQWGSTLSTPSQTVGANTPAFTAAHDLTATAFTWRRVNLAWSGVDPHASELWLERRVAGGTFTQVATLAPSQTSFQDTDLQPVTEYQYRLVARAADQTTSSPSNVGTATTPAFIAGQNLTAAAQGSSAIRLDWSAVDSEATELRVERREAGTGAFEFVIAVPPSQLSAVDGGLMPSTNYEYRLVARAGTVTSAPSNIAMAMTAP